MQLKRGAEVFFTNTSKVLLFHNSQSDSDKFYALNQKEPMDRQLMLVRDPN